MKKLSKDQRNEVKLSIEAAALGNGISNLSQITLMQSKAAQRKDEVLVKILCDIKHDYI